MRRAWQASAAPALAASDRLAAQLLARQKALATGLVGLCALIYAAAKAFEGRYPALAYAAASAEAAIIGALADWYAVTALFRHPLGLRLPHTAIVPANQARIAEHIGDFVARHFLAGSRVGEKVGELDPAASVGRFIAQAEHRKKIAAHVARLLPDAVEAIDRAMLCGEIERGVLDRLSALDFMRLIGTFFEIVTRNNRHHAILDELIAQIASRLSQPGALDALRESIRGHLPTLFRFFLADAYLVRRLVEAAHLLLQEVSNDKAHPLRAEFDRLVLEFLGKLGSSPEHREKVEALKQELLARAELRDLVAEGLARAVTALRADVEREHGIIRRGFEAFLSEMAERLQHDAALRDRLNRWLADAAASMTERYKHEVASFVAAQVKSWDTRHAVRTIELSIGKDLQYIRINGALVGGLIGLAIFSATKLALR